MQLLFIVPYIPTPARTRPYSLLHALLKRGHRLTLATVYGSPAEQQALVAWQAQGVEVLAAPLSTSQKAQNLLRAVFSPLPLQSRAAWNPALMQSISARLAQPSSPVELVHIEHLRAAPYGVALQAQCRLPVVWDSVDCLSLLLERSIQHNHSPLRRWLTRIEHQRMQSYESHLSRQFARVLVTSPTDQEALLEVAGSKPPLPQVEVLPNGVDLDTFQPVSAGRHADSLVMTGRFNTHANITAALVLVNEIMPFVWARRPQVKVILAGSDPVPEINALAQRHTGRVTVTGSVPDLRPYLHLAAVAVAPIVSGVGIQNKVLEAMACATPVVASSQAVSALSVQLGYDLVAADLEPGQPDGGRAFAQAILALLEDPAHRQRIGDAGREYVERHHSWERITTQLEGIYRQVMR